MHICESFDLPGLASPDEIRRTLDERPRKLTLAGVKLDACFYAFVYLIAIIATILAVYNLLNFTVSEVSLAAWGAIFAIVPVAVLALPCGLVSHFRKCRRRFENFEYIYKNGIPACGNVVMMSLVSGNDYSSYFVKHGIKRIFSKRRVRVDYAFLLPNDDFSDNVDKEVITGSVYIRERNARFLALNDEVCILYVPADPAKNMLFPIPGEEFCSSCHK